MPERVSGAGSLQPSKGGPPYSPEGSFIRTDSRPGAMFGRAGILSKNVKNALFDYTVRKFTEKGEFFASDKELPSGAGMPVVASLDAGVYGQMLAKIALGVAVDRFGIDALEPLIREFILGDPAHAGYWINGSKPEEPITHLTHRASSGTMDIRGRRYAAVDITLFADIGGPTNTVIIGPIRSEPCE